MSIQRTSTSPVPLTLQRKYDVFLSFRGDDTRRGFTRNLYTALEHQGIRTFMDDPKLRKGEVIAPALLTAIEESRIAIIVLSKNYASSRWCLDELVRILECMKASETVLPVFYDVDPCEVRWQTGSFGEAFIKLEGRFSDDKEKLLTWRTALAEVANMSGWTSNDERYETELIRKIVGDIWKKLPHISFGYAENLVGMDRILEPVHSLLGVEEDDVRFIGIWGMGGIGKTTMVRAVKDKISPQFECTFLISNVRDSIEKDGLLSLQKQLLKGMIQADQIDQIFDHHEAATALRRWLSRKKVLLILDDVKDHKDLELLAGNQKWFGFGSRVLITTRDEHLLIKHRVERRLKVEALNDYHSLQLFSRKAFKRSYPETDFLDLSRSVVNYAKGLPLALEVLGSSLFGRDQRAWESALKQLGRVCNSEIHDVLKISYKDLDPVGQKIFLDIACFFNGEDKGRITDVLTSCGFSAEFQIDVLMERSLLIESYGRLRMHDLLQEMGHEIVRQESLNNELGRRSRLWHFEDVKYVLTKNAGTEAIEGIFVNSTHKSEAQVDVTPQSFSMMRELRFLKIKDVKLPNGLRYLPDSLRILDWKGYPSESLPSYFNPQNLLELILCYSCIKHFQIGTEPMRYLKTVNLSRSLNLINTPTFKDMPNLEVLLLEGCISLCKVDPGIQVLERLVVLNLEGCENLVHFASSVSGLKSLKVLNLSGCSKLKKLPNDIGHLESLEELRVNGTGIRELPPSIGMLERLSLLEIKECKDLVCLPASIGGLNSLKSLDLFGCSNLDKLPDELGHIAGLEKLDVGRSVIREVPSFIGSLNNLKELSFAGCKAQSSKSWSMMLNPFRLLKKTSHSPVGLSLPCLSGLHSLTKLNLSDCNLSEGAIPDDFGCLASLEVLDLRNNQFVTLPESIGQLSSLEFLHLDECRNLRSLPESIGQLSSLEFLHLDECRNLRSLPESIGQLSSLGGLYLEWCRNLQSLPENIGQLSSLGYLYLDECRNLRSLPESIGQLSSLGYLHLDECRNLRSLPESIGQLSSLGYLHLDGCRNLRSLPESIGQLSSLGGLHLDGCRNLRSLPESIGQLSSLEGLQLDGCRNLRSLPESIGQLSSLDFLTLDECRNLRSLPESIGQLSSLEDLDLDGCRNLQSLPESIGQLSSLGHLHLRGCRNLRSLPESIGGPLLYGNDLKELQTLLKQSGTKRSIQQYGVEVDNGASSSSASQAHPKRIKQLHLADA